MKKILSLLLACALLLGLLAGCGSSPTGSGSNGSTTTRATTPTGGTTAPAASTPNEDFTKIFNDHYIVWMPESFFGMDSAAFAIENSDGSISCMQFGYKDDVVCAYVETMYINIAGMSDADKSAFDAQVRQEFAGYEALSYARVTYSMGSSYYAVSVRLDDLDQPEILQSAVDMGMMTVTGSGALSMSLTESSLLAQGYTKR